MTLNFFEKKGSRYRKKKMKKKKQKNLNDAIKIIKYKFPLKIAVEH